MADLDVLCSPILVKVSMESVECSRARDGLVELVVGVQVLVTSARISCSLGL